MLGNVDLLATYQPRLQFLSQHSATGETADQLNASFRAAIDAALIDDDLGHEVAITPGDRQPLIYAGQDLLAVRDAAPIPCLPAPF